MLYSKSSTYTSEDYWSIPDGERAELINGKFYELPTPNTIHQLLVGELSCAIHNYIDSIRIHDELIISPFAVNLTSNNQIYVEPDIIVVADKTKINDRECTGAPDFIIEIVSPSSRKMDYSTKNALYSEAGVREYWVVDPEKGRTTVYRYEEDAAPMITPFSEPVKVGIYDDLSITIDDFLK